MKRDFIAISDISRQEFDTLMEMAIQLKKIPYTTDLLGKTLTLIFHKPSLRTRVSFEVAMQRLGGNAIFMTEKEIGIGSREALKDVAKVLSRYVHGIVIRTFSQNWLEQFAHHATVPVINALTDSLHPCQIMGDLLTVKEHLGRIENIKVAFVGDGNNVFNSWVNAARLIPMELVLVNPKWYNGDAELIQKATKEGVSKIIIEHDPIKGVEHADVIYTDVWASMGQESEKEARYKEFMPYQVNSKLVSYANDKALVMHCLPAHRGEEITDEIVDGKQSVVYDQAENRLHAQRAILKWLLT